MINALKLILDFLLKSRIIQCSIGISVIIVAISLGSAIYLQAKSGKCFSDIFGVVKEIVSEVK